MKPLILEFAESPTEEILDLSFLEYDNELNLTVIKGTSLPAVNELNQRTQTLTKADGEGSDIDKESAVFALGTMTQTRVMIESSDKDKELQLLEALMATRTLTEVGGEKTDSDK